MCCRCAALALIVLPAVLSSAAPKWWAGVRQGVLPPLRLVVAALFGAAVQWPSTWPSAAVLRTVALGGAAAGYPVLLRVHLPLQLLSLWVMAAATAAFGGLYNGLQAAMAHLAINFVLPSVGLYLFERHQRQRFLRLLRRHAPRA